MPRLLLVDDNPSIHRIAESLLAHTDVVLVCASSAPEALDLLSRGEQFDVALVDTSMPGMDGWSLLERLRALPETARMPIALMAGVLDPIDPSRLGRASIQGFLKKPIELRELAERVLALAATPVAALAVPAEVPAVDLAAAAAELEDDVLALAEEDLWPEAIAALPEAVPEVVLDLEELDLESLGGDLAVPAPAAEPEVPSAELELLPEPEPAAPAVEPEPEAPFADLADLDLEALAEDLAEPAPMALEVEPEPEAPIAELTVLDLEPLAEEPAVPEPVDQAPEPDTEAVTAEVAEADEPALAGAAVELAAAQGQEPDPQGQPSTTDAAARELVQAILADPELLEALARAVVARLGDDALREIAWEILPDLAGRLQK